MSDKDMPSVIYPKFLVPALRQYRHNNSDEFVTAYDYKETHKLVQAKADLLIERVNNIKFSKPDYGLETHVNLYLDDALEIIKEVMK